MRLQIFLVMFVVLILGAAQAHAVCPPPYTNTVYAHGDDVGLYFCDTAEANAQAECMANLTAYALAQDAPCESYCSSASGYDDCTGVYTVTAANLCERLHCDQDYIPVIASATADGSFTGECACFPEIIVPPHG